jgi:predicted nucleic acid-binding protein
MTPIELHIEYRGIPHLAKNVRDVGHPTFVAGTESRSLISQLASASRLLGMLAAAFEVIPMDANMFREWARVMAGKSDHLLEDGMIAATARVRGLVVVTRNVRDFAMFRVEVLNPFKSA